MGRTRACLPCLLQKGHRLRHRLLGDEKKKYVGRIEALPRRSLDRLEELGLARRAPDPRDRRSVLVTRTRKGNDLLTDLRGLLVAAAKTKGGGGTRDDATAVAMRA